MLLAVCVARAVSAEDKTAETPISPVRQALGFHYGPAMTASGSIVGGASDGLSLLEKLINNGYLYAPTVSPVIQRVGPYYKIPPFQLGSNEFGFHYERWLSGAWSWTVALNYLDITAHVDLPATFVDPARLGVTAPGTFQVTAENHTRITLATALEVQAGLLYEFRHGQLWNPYARFGVGVGRGYLGEDHAATLWEENVFGAGGVRIEPASSLFVWAEAQAVGHTAQTRATNPVDRKKVLVNPGRGNIYIGRLSIGTGLRL
ncbi:MAG: hypothetical protein HY042_11715 [Spirochaetia bacterium]|nr:hypothetical protein [Spirochaetia bacterium]